MHVIPILVVYAICMFVLMDNTSFRRASFNLLIAKGCAGIGLTVCSFLLFFFFLDWITSSW